MLKTTILIAVFLTGRCIAMAQLPFYHSVHFTNENGLPQNSIKALEFDIRGYLWMATEMGVVRFDGSQFKWYDKSLYPQLGSNRIAMLRTATDAVVYFTTDDNRYYKISADGKLNDIVPRPGLESWMENGATGFAFQVYDSIEAKITAGELDAALLPDAMSLRRSLVNSMLRTGDRYYYFTAGMEMITTDTALRSFRKVKFRGIQPAASKQACSLLQDDENLYLRDGQMLYRIIIDREDQVSLQPFLKIGDIPGITSLALTAGQDVIVLGTLSDGLYVFTKQYFITHLLDDLEANVFYAVAPYHKNGFISKKAAFDNGKVIPLKDNFTSEALLRTRDGHYWLNRWQSRSNAGLVELDGNLQQTRFVSSPDLRVTCMQQFRDGSIWLSAQNEYIGRLDQDYIQWSKLPGGIPKNFQLATFIETASGDVWLAGGRGVYIMKAGSGAIAPVAGLDSVTVRAMVEDSHGTIWLGSYGSGFFAWRKGKLTRMPLDKQQYLLTAHQFIEDSKGNYWIPTNRGLFCVHIDDLYHYLDDARFPLYYHYFDNTSGFLSNEFNGGCTPAGCRLEDGSIVLPSIRGAVQFRPEEVPVYLSRNPIYIDAITIGNRQFSVPAGNTLQFDRKAGFLEITISSPFFGNQDNNHIEYQLEGISPEWRALPRDQKLTFNELSAGSYTLRLRKRAGFGKDNLIQTSMAITVPPFFHETISFKLIIAAILILATIAFARVRMQYLINQKKRLEKEIRQRTVTQTELIGSLEQTVNALESSQDQIRQDAQFRQQLAMIIAHDLQSPLRFLSQTTAWLEAQYGVNRNQDFSGLLREISKSTQANHVFIEDIGYWIRSMGSDFTVNTKLFPLQELLVEIADFFAPLAREKNNRIIVAGPPDIKVNTDRQLLRVILRNMVDNANKFTAQGQIVIEAQAEANTCTLIVTDNGSGIKPALLLELQQRVTQSAPVDTHFSARGNGFRFITAFARRLNLQLKLSSRQGAGATIALQGLACVVTTEEQSVEIKPIHHEQYTTG
ncbi:sensor histidine kinase [Flavihumibacter petaseus]|nr:sensor histidine kinase [Flavihumibacter petaseus]